MSGIEGAADMVTGGLIGRAIEPHAGEGHADDHAHGRCLNCGTALIGEHCHACGQAAHVHRTIGAIGHELAHGVFHFEGKIWRTLPMLVFRPGELTRRYVDGERARFVSPLAMFLFSVFLLFAIVASLPGWDIGKSDMLKAGLEDSMTDLHDQVGDQRKRAVKMFADAREKLAEERAKPTPDPDRIARYQQRMQTARDAHGRLEAAERALPIAERLDVSANSPAEWHWLNEKFAHARENPKLMLYKMKMSAYKYSWALIPISLPFLWLLFPFSRRFNMYDHAVFATYSLTFMSLLTTALALIGLIGLPTWLLMTASMVVPPLHIYKQLRGAYRLGRISALLRATILIGVIFWIIIPAFALGLVYLGVAD